MDRPRDTVAKLRVKKNLFKTTTTPDGLVRVEPLSPDKFYGKAVGSLRVFSEVNDCAQKSSKKYNEPTAAQRSSRPKDEALKSKGTERPHRASDDLSNDFFVFPEANDFAHKSPKVSSVKYYGSAAQRPSQPKDVAYKSKQTIRSHRASDDLPNDFLAKFVSAICGDD